MLNRLAKVHLFSEEKVEFQYRHWHLSVPEMNPKPTGNFQQLKKTAILAYLYYHYLAHKGFKERLYFLFITKYRHSHLGLNKQLHISFNHCY